MSVMGERDRQVIYDEEQAGKMVAAQSRLEHARFDTMPDPLLCSDCHREEEPGEEFMHWAFRWDEPVCPSCQDMRAANYEEWEASQASGIEVRSEYREEDYEAVFDMYDED